MPSPVIIRALLEKIGRVKDRTPHLVPQATALCFCQPSQVAQGSGALWDLPFLTCPLPNDTGKLTSPEKPPVWTWPV